MEINKNTKLERVLKLKGAEAVLSKYNFPCITCPMAQMEMQTLKLGEICKYYDIEVDKLMKELNKLK